MQSALLSMICRVGVFMVCAQAIVHFRARAVYEKYLKLLTSVMLLTLLLVPLGKLFLGIDETVFTDEIRQFEILLEQSLAQGSDLTAEWTKRLEEQSMAEAKKQQAAEETAGEGEADREEQLVRPVESVEIRVEERRQEEDGS